MYNSQISMLKTNNAVFFDLELKEERCPIYSEKGIPSQIDESHYPYLHSTDPNKLFTYPRSHYKIWRREFSSLQWILFNVMFLVEYRHIFLFTYPIL